MIKPYYETELNVVNFSSGADSTALLLMMIERKMPIDYIVYINTMIEFPQIYQHINRITELIKPLFINILPIDLNLSHWNKDILTNIERDNFKAWCTKQKNIAIINFLSQFKKNIINYQGITFDERERINNGKRLFGTELMIKRFPLIEWEITKKDTLQYCYKLGLNWGGLYDRFNSIVCMDCPLNIKGD